MSEKQPDFKVLDDRLHVILRPEMYLGSTSLEEKEYFIEGKLKTVQIVPALIKMTNEIIDNVIDVSIRTGHKKLALKITVNKDNCIVEDTGPGIPVVSHETEKKLLPELAWTTLKAGTSFEDNREGPSANGVGASLTCIFSRKFVGETCDGKNYCRISATNNMEDVEVFSKKKSGATGTTVQFYPDFSRLETDSFTQDHINVIKERLYPIATIFPEIAITFNGEKIKGKSAKDISSYLKLFGEEFVSYQGENYFFGVFHSPYDEYKQASNINSLDVPDGGTHEEQIMVGITYALKELIKKKHKLDMAPAEIKRCLMLVFVGRGFKNLKFSSQTKTSLNNTVAETKEYLNYGDIPFNKIAKQILANPELIDPIIQSKLAKQAAADARAVTLAQKKLNQAKVKKHIPANSKNPQERELFLCEGDSALGCLKKVRDPKTQGGFALRGKMLNVWGLSDKEILQNKEISNFLAITGLKLGMNDKEVMENLTYHSINIFSDQDLDGYHCRLLVANMIWRWPILFTKNIVKIVESPIVILEKCGKSVWFYSLDEYKTNLSKYGGWSVRYIKGLGSLREHEYEKVINDKDHKIPISVDNAKMFDLMFSDDVGERKKFLLNI